MNFISILPFISFILGIAVAVLQIYVTSRIGKIKEDILTIVRHEMVTKEVLELVRQNLTTELRFISQQITNLEKRLP